MTEHKDTDHFILYANCIPVKGYTRSCICDLHRNDYELIPDILFDILTEHKSKSIKEIKEYYHNQFNEIIDEYFSFLLGKEFIYLCDVSIMAFFPEMDRDWRYPGQVTNAIIDCQSLPAFISHSFVKNLCDLGCHHIQFRVFDNMDISLFLEHAIKPFELSSVAHISLQFPFTEANADHLKTQLEQYTRLTEIVLYAAPENHSEYIDCKVPVHFSLIKKDISSATHCGIVDEKYFAPNIPHYTESLHHNTCLNRKISIDVDGNIKNCPSMTESFGNIKDTTLAQALNKTGFKKYWDITKEQVSVCQNCEFRHICTDCRAYLDEPEDIYSKPLKCGYNPYTAEWQDWSSNPLKEKTIQYYRLS